MKPFIKLLSLCTPSADNAVIERYVILLFDNTSAYSNVNECRGQLFMQQGRIIDNCPPTQEALIQHTHRAMLQTSIWANFLQLSEPDVDLNEWGWNINFVGDVSPKLIKLPIASQACN